MTDASNDNANETTLMVDGHGGWAGLLGTLTAGRDLSADAAGAAMADILGGRATDAQIAGFIVGLRQKGESVEEMVGLVDAMLAAAEPLHVPVGTIDIVGTGGSAHRRAHALNVSTMSSIVAAAAGATVCKHGNYRASSTSGSFDFLAELGVNVLLTPAQLEACIEEVGLGFALAKTFHPAMRFAGPVRAQLGIPTVFNVLGPLAHPGRLTRQLIGVAEEATAERMASVVAARGVDLVWVVAGHGGIDELSTTGSSVVFEVTPSGVRRFLVDPTSVSLDVQPDLSVLAGGDAAENVAIFRRLADGSDRGPRADMIALNAGAALVVAGVADTLADGVSAAASALADGRVTRLLDQLVATTNRA